MKKWLIPLIVILLYSVSNVGCSNSLPTATPVYIKDVVAYQEGSDGIVVYFVLADRNGEETTASGTVHLKITQDTRSYIYTLYEKTFSVDKSDFHNTTVGSGAFERKRILCSFGRIPYSSFNTYPSGDFPSGDVIVEFTTENGQVLTGSDTILY